MHEPPPLVSTAATPHMAVAHKDRPAPWLREIASGGIGTVITLAVVLTLGLLGFAALGDAAAQVGIRAAFATAAVGGLVYALAGRLVLPMGGPSSATALIFAALLASLVRDPQISLADPRDLAAVLAAGSVAVVLMGAMQVLLAALGLGRLAKFVPQPVLAGFMNGVAVLIVLSQVPTLLGLPAGATGIGPGTLALLQPAALGVGLATAAITWAVAWRRPDWPAHMIGLLAGLLLHTGLTLLLPQAGLGLRIGPLPAALPLPDLPLVLMAPDVSAFVLRHGVQVLTTALVLALIGSLESVLSALALDQHFGARHDTRRELMAMGAANMVVGLFGGLPLVLLRARAIVTWRAGGRSMRAALAGALVFGLLYLLGGPLLSLLPLTVLAGIMLTIAVGLVDQWTRQLLQQLRSGEHSREMRRSLVIVGLVCGVTVWKGFALGVAVGVVVALAVFIRGMNRSLIRARFTAVAQPSHRLWPAAQEALLAPVRHRIVLLELEGALFFGSADRLVVEAERLAADCRFLVLDFKRVSTLDETGAVLLQQLSGQLAQRGIGLLLAGVTDTHPHGLRLRAFGCFRGSPRSDWFPDADRATEAAERVLLALADPGQQGQHLPSLPLQACTLFRHLDETHCAIVTAHMQEQRLRAGERLFAAGDPADCLYVLTQGSISILDGPTGTRFFSFSPGLMLGEVALLDGGGRSASATADTDVVVHVLTRSGLAAIAAQSPALGVQLYANIALHLAERLRAAATVQRSRHG